MLRRVAPSLGLFLLASLQPRAAAAQTETAAAEPEAPREAEAAPAAASLLLLPAHVIGVDPAVAAFVDRALRRRGEALGYAASDAEAALPSGVSHPPGMAELQRLAVQAGARYAAVAVIWASNGRYAVQVRVARGDGSVPAAAQAEASNLALEAVVERLLAQLLPPAAAGTGAPASSAAAPAEAPLEAPPPAAAPETGASAAPAAPDRPRWRLALHNAVAFGFADDGFVSDAIGARVDRRVDRALWLGLYAGYANLPGRAGRVDGFLSYAQAEQRIALGSGRALGLPLRIAVGYLVRNGGFLRVSSGLAVPLGARTELVVDVLAPTFWATPDKVLFSLDAGLELALEL